MNARLYDPLLGRMLSPDNFVGSGSQGFNRYSYANNNPLNHVDPTGNFVGTIFTAIWDFTATILTKGGLEFWNKNTFNNAWAQFDPTGDWSKTNKAFEIDKGLFTGNPLDILLKWTWNFPQTVAGNAISHGLNVVGLVNAVSHFEGATVLDTEITGGAFTVGNYIAGPRGFRADFRDHLFVHEFGHYLQSQVLGPLYLPSVALPSLLDSWTEPELHGTRWYEADASRRAANWFDERFGGVAGSADFFDRNAFITGQRTAYRNPRPPFGNNQGGGNPISPVFRFSDIIYGTPGVNIGYSLFRAFLRLF